MYTLKFPLCNDTKVDFVVTEAELEQLRDRFSPCEKKIGDSVVDCPLCDSAKRRSNAWNAGLRASCDFCCCCVIGRAIAEELGFGVVRHSDITRCYRYGSLKMQEAIKAADRFCNREPCRMVFNGLADPERVTKAPYLLLLPECREGMQCAKLNYD